ncbi:MAG: hypothetical protein K2Q25_15690 [Mycobacteriaceae bacterium]|nr:hypothetical protein [Mycobacteriaceae bacterium]
MRPKPIAIHASRDAYLDAIRSADTRCVHAIAVAKTADGLGDILQDNVAGKRLPRAARSTPRYIGDLS